MKPVCQGESSINTEWRDDEKKTVYHPPSKQIRKYYGRLINYRSEVN
jgi:hypothetical protein